MKIALLCSNSGSGGLIKYIEGFLNTNTSHDVCLFCGSELPIYESGNVKIVRTPYASENGMDLLLNRPLKPQLIQILDDFSPDVIVFMNGFMRRGVDKYPCISILHNQLAVDLKLLLKQRPLRLVVSLLAVRKAVLYSFSKADGMIFLSYASKNETDKHKYHYKNGRVILFGQDSTIQPNAYRKERNELVYASTHFPYKNHKRLLKALAKVKSMGRDFHISFIGCSETESLNHLIRKMHLEDNVTFWGWQSHNQTMEIIQQADIYIHASLIESTSNGVLEGVGENATIVCSDLAVFKEALGDCAYYFNPKDTEDMALVILKAMESPKLLSIDMCNNIMKPYNYHNGVIEVYKYAEEIMDQFQTSNRLISNRENE